MKIKEAEKATGLTSKTIRYYESRGLVDVTRQDNSYRDYTDTDIALLKQIKTLRNLGVAIADIKLWRDGVVGLRELVSKRRSELESDSKLGNEQRLVCDSILDRRVSIDDPGSGAAEYTESQSEYTGGGKLALGVDIGTTSVSAQIVSLATGEEIHTYNFDHEAAIDIDGFPDAFAEDAEMLVGRVAGLVKSALGAYPDIVSVGFSGAMHGIVCLDERMNIISPLYTWQNGFGERDNGHGGTICDELRDMTGVRVPTGYGIVTLYALGKLGLLPEETSMVATIADAAVLKLCGLTEPVIHPTMAASLGFWDIDQGKFLPCAAKITGKIRLPRVSGDYEVIGQISAGGKKIPVSSAVGDNQAGVFGSLRDEDTLLVNVGTSGQVSLVGGVGNGEYRPYFGGKKLLSGSILCGGRAYAALADLVSETVSAFMAKPPRREIYALLNRLAENSPSDPLTISTRFCGTRSDPSLRGSISGLSLSSFDLAHLADGILRGIIEELHTMSLGMTEPGRKYGVVVSGNAMRRCAPLRRLCAEAFGSDPMTPAHIEESAFGAALHSAISAGEITREESLRLIKYTEDKHTERNESI